jgi:hypothetical protein
LGIRPKDSAPPAAPARAPPDRAGTGPTPATRGPADGNNRAVPTIMNTDRDEFEKRVEPTDIPVRVTVGAAARR